MAVYTEQIGSPNLEDVTATFDDSTGKVVISGTGATKNFTYSARLFKDYSSQIKTVVVNEGVTKLGNYIFYFWSECTVFDIASTVKEFGNYSFYYTGIYSFAPEAGAILGSTMLSKSSLVKLTIKAGTSEIPSELCRACKKLTDITLPETITKIGKSSFASCMALETFKLPPSVVSLDTGSFGDLEALKTIGLMQNVKGMLYQTFQGCIKLEDGYIPYGITQINGAYNRCHAIRTITVPKSVTRVLDYAFGPMNNLESIYFLTSSTYIAPSSGVTKGATICNSISNSTAKHDKMKIYGFAGSTAETYASTYSIPFVALGEFKSLELITKPNKLTYKIGELLDLEGFYLQAEYEGASFRVPPDSVSGFDSETVGIKTVVLSYEGVDVSFDVTVSEEKEKTLDSISITKLPDNTEYVLMDDFDPTGLEVSANYSDGTSEIISNYTISGVDTGSPGTNIVTVTYEGKTATFSITVYNIVSIKIKEYFGRGSDFFVGDENTGNYRYAAKSLTATYENGEERTISYGNFTETEVDTSKVGSYYTTIKYLNLEIQSPYTVYGSPFTTKTGYPDKDSATLTLDTDTGLCTVSGTGQLGRPQISPRSFGYKVKTLEIGEGISGIHTFSYCSEVSLVTIPSTVEELFASGYTDGLNGIFGSGGYSTAIIRINAKKDSISGSPWGQKSATIIWTAKPQSLNIKTLPDKLKYTVGDTFDPTGIECKVQYSNGKEYNLDGELSYSVNMSESGKQTVTVSCTEEDTVLTAKFQIEIEAPEKVKGIRISKYPDKTYYKIGDSLDTSGMEVMKVTESGKETVVTNYQTSGFNSSKAGTNTVRVIYTEVIGDTESETFSTTFQVQITNDGQNPFEENSDPINITVHWINGEFEDLTNENIQQGSVTLQESICSENYFIFGGCVCNQISFSAHHKQFDGTGEEYYPTGKIEVYLERNKTKLKIFTGEIDTAERASNSLTRNFVAYDYLYKLRNTDIAWWYKNRTVDSQMVFTQKQFRDALFAYLGIEQVETTLEYDNASVPNTNVSNEINAINIIKDLCLQNSVFGWMNRDGKFEYLKLPENSYQFGTTVSGVKIYKYFEAQIHLDTFKSFYAKEGRIWFPREFMADPYPGIFSSGEPSAQEAYEKNIYHNRNSFFVGNQDWLNMAFDADEYGVYTRSKPLVNLCYGTTSKLDPSHLYRAQEYTAEVVGNPFNMIGQTVEMKTIKYLEDGTELPVLVNSYIMSRTLKISGGTSLIDTYSAKNSPYNGNNQQLGKYTPEISATVNQTRSELPTISYEEFSDGTDIAMLADDITTIKKAQLRCIKRIKKADYDALVASGNDRKDTLYFTYEEG